ncbi:MAG TPA: glycosyltransferase [Candidatus Kryptonia bacterium]|nr:glycosyltransferase [Candidatus Kryptonia bacterium]
MEQAAAQQGAPALSVVVPVYNGASFIADSLRDLTDYLARQSQGAELIVVDDGSTDATPQLVRNAAATARVPVLVLRNQDNQGKGAAILRGMQQARGTHRVFLDADLAYPPAEIERIVEALSAGADVAIACRVHPSSRVLLAPLFFTYYFARHAGGRVFNWLVRLLLLPGIVDSQAGLKGFRAAAADQLFTGWLPRGFNFDLALLFRARRLVLIIAQVPVVYRYESEPSTVRFARDLLRAARDVIQIRARLVSDRFERWSIVLTSWREHAKQRWQRALQSRTALPLLLAAGGLALTTLFIGRLANGNGWVAAGSWLIAVASVLLVAWRSDLRRPALPLRLFHTRVEAVLFGALLLIGATLRVLRLGDLPPMVHGDSAECGLLGLAILHGQVPDVFDFSPWYDVPYLSFVPYALSFALTGPTIVGLRLPSVLPGVATMIPLYYLVRGWFGVRAALLVAAMYAVSHGAIHFSRIGLWNIQVLFYEVTAFALLLAGWRRGRMAWVTAGGVTTGLALYSYTGGRLIPIVVAAFLLSQIKRRRWQVLRVGAYFGCGVVIAAAPLVINYLKHPEVLAADRTASVWVFAEINRPHVQATLGTTSPSAVLWKQVKRTVGGFVSRGDQSAQYGTQQPILSLVAALLALAGLVVLLRNWRQAHHVFVLLWMVLGLLLASVLVIDPPSSTRLLVLFPVPFILAAVGLEALLELGGRWRSLRQPELAAVVYVLVVAQSAGFNLVGYHRFITRMSVMSREWDVLQVFQQFGSRYQYYLYTGPFLLADSPIFKFFSTGTRAVSGFSEADLPERVDQDSAFILTPDFRNVGLAISERFPGAERQVLDEEGVRQLIIYRCTRRDGCARGHGS